VSGRNPAASPGSRYEPCENSRVDKAKIITIVSVIAAIIIAWILVNALLSVLVFVAKIAVVAVVAGIVYVIIRFIARDRYSD